MDETSSSIGRIVPQRKFKVGDKVKIKSKSIGEKWGLFSSHAKFDGFVSTEGGFIGYIKRVIDRGFVE